MARSGVAGARPGLLGMLAVLVGAAAVVASFTALDWYVATGSADSVGARGFEQLKANAASSGFPGFFFDRLGWLLLIVVVVVGLMANLPSAAADGLRVLGLFAGLVGAAGTYLAIAESPGETSVVQHATVGLWCAIGGFLLAGIGAALGPRRARSAV